MTKKKAKDTREIPKATMEAIKAVYDMACESDLKGGAATEVGYSKDSLIITIATASAIFAEKALLPEIHSLLPGVTVTTEQSHSTEWTGVRINICFEPGFLYQEVATKHTLEEVRDKLGPMLGYKICKGIAELANKK